MPTQDESLELRAISAAAAKSDDNLKNSSRDNSIRADEGSVENDKEDGKDAAAAAAKFPTTGSWYRCRRDGLVKEENDANKVQRLLGKLIRLQQAHSGNKIESSILSTTAEQIGYSSCHPIT